MAVLISLKDQVLQCTCLTPAAKVWDNGCTKLSMDLGGHDCTFDYLCIHLNLNNEIHVHIKFMRANCTHMNSITRYLFACSQFTSKVSHK